MTTTTNTRDMKNNSRRHRLSIAAVAITGIFTTSIIGAGVFGPGMQATFVDTESSRGQSVTAGSLNGGDTPANGNTTFTAARTNPNTCALNWGALANPTLATGYIIDRYKNTGANPSSGYARYLSQNGTQEGSTNDYAPGVRPLNYRLKTSAGQNGSWTSFESIIANCAEAVANDNFNRSTSSTLGTSPGGFVWNNGRGSWYANGSTANTSTSPSSNPFAYLNYTEEPNANVSATVAGDGDALVFRAAADGSHLRVRTEASTDSWSTFQTTGSRTVPRYIDRTYYDWRYNSRTEKTCWKELDSLIVPHDDKYDLYWSDRRGDTSSKRVMTSATAATPSDYPSDCDKFIGKTAREMLGPNMDDLRQIGGQYQIVGAIVVERYDPPWEKYTSYRCNAPAGTKFCDSKYSTYTFSTGSSTTTIPGASGTNTTGCPNYYDPNLYPGYTCTSRVVREQSGTTTKSTYGWVDSTSSNNIGVLEYVYSNGAVVELGRRSTYGTINTIGVSTSGTSISVSLNGSYVGNFSSGFNTTATGYGVGRSQSNVDATYYPYKTQPQYDEGYQSLNYGDLTNTWLIGTRVQNSTRGVYHPSNLDNFNIRWN